MVWHSSPSLSLATSPRSTQPTSSSSRLRAMPMTSPGNWTISLYITSERPSTLATPSARVRMCPTFFLTVLVWSLAICCSICSMTELIWEGGAGYVGAESCGVRSTAGSGGGGGEVSTGWRWNARRHRRRC